MSLVAQMVKHPPAMWETSVRSLGWEDPLKKGKATHSSILDWRIPCRSPWGRKESDLTEHTLKHTYTYTYTWASLVAQLVKNPPAMQETPV